MTTSGNGNGLLRTHEEGDQRVTFIELFFDLVYVFAVTQLSHLLLGHLSALGIAQTLLLLLAIWRAWTDTAWVTNWFCVTANTYTASWPHGPALPHGARARRLWLLCGHEGNVRPPGRCVARPIVAGHSSDWGSRGAGSQSPDWGSRGAGSQSPDWGRRRGSARCTLLSLIVERAERGGNSSHGKRTDTQPGLGETCVG